MRLILREAVDALPDNYREVLLLRDVEELSTTEAATVLQISTSSIKVRLHRARMMLQKDLAPKLKQLNPKRRLLRWSIECKHVWAHISEYLDGTLDPQLAKSGAEPTGALRDLLSDPGFDAQYLLHPDGRRSRLRATARLQRTIARKTRCRDGQGRTGHFRGPIAMSGVVDDEVRDVFGDDKDQGDNRKRNLEGFRPFLPRGHWLDSPLRRRSRPQAADSPDDVQIDDGASDCKDHHRNPYCVCVEPAGRAVQASGRSQSAKTNHHSDAADRHHCGARALQQDE